MKKFWFLLSLFLCFSFVSALDVDTQIDDALNKQHQEEMLKNMEDLNETFSLTQVNSCSSMDNVLGDFLELYKKYYPKQRYPIYLNGGRWIMESAVMEDSDMATSAVDVIVPDSKNVEWAWGDDFSTTNLQKIWVDEPETLKSNGKYLFYYVQDAVTKESYVSIIKTPTQSNLKDAAIVKKIRVPGSLTNVQLFLQGDYLIILASRYSDGSTTSILGNAHTVAIIYNVSDLDHLQLEKMVDVNGSYQDARLVGDQLYLISQIYLDWYYYAYDMPVLDFDTLLPTTTQFSLKNGNSSTSGSASKLYTKEKISLPCSSTFYLLPSEESLKEYGITPNFTLISSVSISSDKQPEQKLVFGSVQDIHMSKDSLYLPSPIYFSSPMRCLWCWWPNYSVGQNTLIHKMTLGSVMKYEDSKIIPGIPLSQYSMDEDNEWNFRILTKTWNPNLATQFFVFDRHFSLKGTLLNIEPWEEFKSSRYIWDKLYLVTFEQIDPLFVVDIANISSPKIVWELKIPWYSTYLHPYDSLKDGIQYLIGLWYSTATNQRWWTTNENVKLDLYKIDFNAQETVKTKCSSLITKDVNVNSTSLCAMSAQPCSPDQLLYEQCVHSVNSDNIAVSLLSSHEFSGDMSYSPSLYNPRMFVWDTVKKNILIPLFSCTQQEIIQTGWNGSTWNSIDYVPLFAGVKGLQVSSDTGFKEVISQNFASLSTSTSYYYDYWSYDSRVWYVGDVSYFLKWGFVSFFKGNTRVDIGVY